MPASPPPASLYERVLDTGFELPAPAPPRPSAAVVPWRRRADGELEVYWIRRARSQRFMGGWYAFPGGGVARRDGEIPTRGEAAGVEEGPPLAGMPEGVLDGIAELGPVLTPGLAGCACRELFEEVGIVPAAPGWRVDEPGRLREARRSLIERRGRFAQIAGELGLVPDLSRLAYAGRWLTPPLGPVRFDNRFFLLEWGAGETLQPEPWPAEVELGEWIRPARGLERWRAGELLTAPPILHLLSVLAEDGPSTGLARLRDASEANLGPHRRIEFSPGILIFPLPTPTLPPATHTNTLLVGSGEAVLIDPGCPREADLERLAAALAAARDALGRRVTAIWLTHHHPDHVGGVEWLRRRLGCPVLAHAGTAARLAGRGIAIDASIGDGERFELAGEPRVRLRAVHTPGHARGHLAFLEETRGALVAGDMVSGLSTIVIDPPEGDMDDYIASLERLEGLAPKTLFPAHGPVLDDARRHLRAARRHRLWREARVLEAWSGGARRPAEMVAGVYPELPEIARPLAERQITAHLERLERAGRLAVGAATPPAGAAG